MGKYTANTDDIKVQQSTDQPTETPVIDQPEGPTKNEVYDQYIYGPLEEYKKADSIAKQKDLVPKSDWFETRLNNSFLDVNNLMDLYGKDGFNDLLSSDDYWDKKEIKDKFINTYGTYGKSKFEEMYDLSKAELSNYKLNRFQRSQNAYELAKDDFSDIQFDTKVRFSNLAGTVMEGKFWSDPTKDYRENFNNIRVKKTNAKGEEYYEIEEYSPELLKSLEEDATFGGLAYSDKFRAIDPNVGVDGIYFEAIYNGKIYDDFNDKKIDVKNEQVVSRWDIETGSWADGLLKNNKLQADGFIDYAKIIARAPINMTFNMMDMAVQLTRASIAGGYGIANIFTSTDLDVNKSDIYKYFSNKGIQAKSRVTSMTTEAIHDGFFGSLEAALMTTADVALQVALAGGLGRAGAGLAEFVHKKASPALLAQAQKRYAEMAVRGTLTALATKDSYNEALANGFTTSEASVITGAMALALWQATKYSSYIYGDYEAKALASDLQAIIKNDRLKILKASFSKLDNKIVSNSAKAVTKEIKESKAALALGWAKRSVNKVYSKASKKLPTYNRYAYAARQEGIEEMAEELFQDGVKHAASAYGVLMNNAKEAGKGRYLTIFDDGYFLDALERYATSAVAGGFGGPMGIVGNKVNVSPITSTSSIVDVIMNGKSIELIKALDEAKANSEIGPEGLSTEYNIDLQAFEPMVKGSEFDSLSDMVYATYMNDINVITTFISKGMFGTARARIEEDYKLQEFVENNSIRKDFMILMGDMIDFHTKTGISTSVFEDLDGMDEETLKSRLPDILDENQKTIENKRKEIKNIKEQLKKDKATKTDTTTETDKEPKTVDKDKKEVLLENDNSKLTRLEKEVKLSQTVTSKDIRNMLGMYRKTRAIGNGSASEFYLLQNEFQHDSVLGRIENRADKFKDLGKNPLLDALSAMRVRSLEDEKIHLSKVKKSRELDEKFSEIKDISNLNIKELVKLYNTNPDIISEKVIKKIENLFNKVDLKEFGSSFDPDNKESIFSNPDGTLNELKMIDAYENILKLSSNNEAIEFSSIIADGKDAKAFFKDVAKDPSNATIPQYWDIGYGTVMATDKQIERPSFIDSVLKNGKGIVLEQVKTLDTHTLAIREIFNNSQLQLATGTFFDEKSFSKKGLGTLLRKDAIGTLDVIDLVDAGMSEINELVETAFGEYYTKIDSKDLENVLDQIEVKEALADMFKKFTTQGISSHYMDLLANFRKNVLDVLDFSYSPGEENDTAIETHSYKDYSVFSDFFTDFIYDPIQVQEIARKKRINPKLLTDEDNKVLENIDQRTRDLNVFRYDSEKNSVDEIQIDYDILTSALDTKYNNLTTKEDFKRAMDDFNSNIIKISGLVIEGSQDEEPILLELRGMFKLKAAKWLFSAGINRISNVKNTDSHLPYIKNKNDDITNSLNILNNFISSDIENLSDAIMSKVPEYQDYLDTEFVSSTNKLSSTDKGALVIKLEKALYEIYNNIGITGLTTGSWNNLVIELENYLLINRSSIMGSETKRKDYLAILATLTSDFTPFYSRLKKIINDSGENDNIVLADQEYSAKYAAAWIYSEPFQDKVKELLIDKVNTASKGNASFINTLYIPGVAGSGKSTAVTNLGMSIAASVLKDSGNENNAILPVSNHKKQIDIISATIGDLAKGNEGITVTELEELLKSATLHNDADSIKKLQAFSTILIDEITYVKAIRLSDEYTQLLDINNYIIKYNDSERAGKSKLSMIVLGSPDQSGIRTPISDVPGSALANTSINSSVSVMLKEMTFSFRNRNSFLRDSISILKSSKPQLTVSSIKSAKVVSIKKGLKYGTRDGRLYGANIISTNDRNTINSFREMLNDPLLYKNIKDILDKEINTEAEAEKNNKKRAKFNILIVPESISELDGSTSKIQELMNDPKYKEFFEVISYAEVGGSEANYVLAEFPEQSFNDANKTTKVNAIYEGINTLLTRAFDYVLISNKSEDLVIPSGSAAIDMGDGKVMIPKADIDKAIKLKIKETYLDIFRDVEEYSDGSSPNPSPKPKPKPDPEPDPFTKINFKITTIDTNIDINATVKEQTDLFLANVSMNDFLDNYFKLESDDHKDALYNFYSAANAYISHDYITVLEDQEALMSALSEIGKLMPNEFNKFSNFVNMLNLVMVSDPDMTIVIESINNYLGSFIDMMDSINTGNINILNIEIENGITYKDVITTIEQLINEDIKNKNGDINELLKVLNNPTDLFQHSDSMEEILNTYLPKAFSALNITPPEVKTKEEKARNELFTKSITAVINKAAADNNKTNINPPVLKDVSSDDPIFVTLSSWANSKSKKQLDIIFKTLNDFIADESINELVGFPTPIQDLFKNFTRESILKVISEKLETIYASKKEKTTITKLTGQVKKLQKELGMNTATLTAADLRNEILSKELEITDKLYIDGENQDALIDFDNINKLKDLWIKLYGKKKSTIENVFGGISYYNRDKQGPQTLEDYILNAELKRKETVILGITDKTLSTFGKDLQGYNILKSKEEVLALFNFDGSKKAVPTRLELRVVKRGPSLMYTFVVAIQGNTKTVIGQLNTTGSYKNAAINEIVASLKEEVNKMPVSYISKNGRYKNEVKILNIPIKEKLQNIIIARSGSIIKPDGINNKSVADLKNEGINISDNIFVLMNKSDIIQGETSENLTSTMSGDMMILYSMDQNINMDSSEISEQLKKGRKLANNLPIISSDGSIKSNIGVLPINIKVPFTELSRIFKEDDTFKVGEFPSNMSFALQKYFSNFIMQYKPGEKINIKINGINSSVLVTTEMLEKAKEMEDGLNTYFETKKDNKDFITNFDSIYNNLISDKSKGGTLESLQELATAYAINLSNAKKGTLNPNSIIYEKKGTGLYVFNINKYLRSENNTDILNRFNRIADIAKFSIKPSIQKGESDTEYYGTLSRAFIDKLSKYIITATAGIQTPGIAFNNLGATSIIESINRYKKDKKGDKDTNNKNIKKYTLTDGDKKILKGAEILNKNIRIQHPVKSNQIDPTIKAIDELKNKIEKSKDNSAEALNYINILVNSKKLLLSLKEDLQLLNIDDTSDYYPFPIGNKETHSSIEYKIYNSFANSILADVTFTNEQKENILINLASFEPSENVDSAEKLLNELNSHMLEGMEDSTSKSKIEKALSGCNK